MSSVIALAARALKEPVALVDEIEAQDSLARDGARLLWLLVGASMVFGAVVGGYRGGLQIVFTATKLPGLLLLPMILVLPALRALWSVCEVDVSYRRLGLAGLVGAARAALLAAAIGPFLWLIFSTEPDYHVAILVFVATLGIAGLPGLSVVHRAVPTGGRLRPVAIGASLALLVLSSMQTGWLLRPFVLRPRTPDPVFLRAVDADVFTALTLTARSSVGDYDSVTYEPVPPESLP